jgi:membrane protease subunit HflK
MAQKIKFGDGEIKIPQLNIKKIGQLAFLAFIAIVLTGSFYTVGANENGVLTRLGKYSTTTMPGLHFKIPLIDAVENVKVDYQYKLEFGFRTLRPGVKTKYSTRNFDDESWMLTGDLKIAEVKWVVQYKIKDAANYLFNVKNVQNTIRDVSEATMRIMIGDRSFNEVIKSERSAVSDGARLHMQAVLDSYKSGISIQMVQLQGVVPPITVSDSFNEVNRAKQEQETAINEAKQEYNKRIYNIEGEAEKIINEARGYAIDRVNTAKGDVASFEKVLKEYKKAPQITRDRIYLETMETVLSNIPNKVLVSSKLENFLPMLNVNGGSK